MTDKPFRLLCLSWLLLAGALLAGCGGGDDAAIAQGVATDVSGVTQNWDKVISGPGRFTVLSAFGGAAVRDNETGLVWEQAPTLVTMPWSAARGACTTKVVGGRKGWRLPSVAELTTLVDVSVLPALPLPPGHPFTVTTTISWSATTSAQDPTRAWSQLFTSGNSVEDPKTANRSAWCVRGGHNDGSEY